MTWFQIYALYVAPVVLLGVGLLVYWITGWQDGRRHIPGE